LEKIGDNFTMMAAEGYISGASEADIKFYETLMKCAHNEKLLQIYIASHIPLFHENMEKAMCTIMNKLIRNPPDCKGAEKKEFKTGRTNPDSALCTRCFCGIGYRQKD
jgi:hypothetical protein